MSHNCPANGIFKNSLLGLGYPTFDDITFFEGITVEKQAREKSQYRFLSKSLL